jgi:nucleotide-binding universal stress UspA family protein
MTTTTTSTSSQVPRPYRIVAACDFSPLGERAVQEALRLCSMQSAAALHVITVGAQSSVGVLLPGSDLRIRSQEDAQEQARARLEGMLGEYTAQHPRLPLEKIAVYVTTGRPSDCIVSLAAAVDADLIVLGTHGRHGLERVLLGSVAEEVVRRAPCGVFVIRPRDFLEGEKLPEIQPALLEGEHPLLPFRTPPTFHYVHRMSREPSRMMPSL